MSLVLRIIIVGGGIAGLTAAIGLRRKGHRVSVVERHPGCQTIGGPIYLGPNATRVLTEYGMQEKVEGKDILLHGPFTYLRYCDGKVLYSSTPPDDRKEYGYPTWAASRFHVQETLVEFAQELGVDILFNHKVKSVDQSVPAIMLEDGTQLEADLVVGADGINSLVRNAVFADRPVARGIVSSAYNVELPREFLRNDPDLADLLDGTTFWFGPGRWVLAANLPQHGDHLNICLSSNETAGTEGDWSQRGDLQQAKENFKDFDPRVMKFLNGTDSKSCYIWHLADLPPLPTWVSESGKMVLIGDSSHAMVPGGSMGAGICIEDGACLAECLDRAQTLDDLPRVLSAYQAIRRPRAEYCVQRARNFLAVLQLPDGEAQEQRDAVWSRVMQEGAWDGEHIDEPPEPSDIRLADGYVRGHDVFSYTNRQLDKILGV